jgi:D-threonine aldolase
MKIGFPIADTSRLLSPSLVIDRSLVRKNLEGMVRMAGSADRLRPHVKTHKMPAVLRLCAELGITKQKCATIAEAEMTAEAGAADVLIAYPIVGPNIDRVANLVEAFPNTIFRVLVDDIDAALALDTGLGTENGPLSVMIDLDVGMGRTGIEPGEGAFQLAEAVSGLKNLTLDGLHAYDGHIREMDPGRRAEVARPGIEKTLALRDRLQAQGIAVPILVFGGTPTFPVHAVSREPGVELSPGTSTFHDMSYATKFPDLPFEPAAAVLTRVISRPKPGRLCLDLGHKAVAADPAGARVFFPDLPDAVFVGQSEEHLVLDTPAANRYPPGTALLGIPVHVCPTCALHRRAYVVENGALVDEWDVAARDRFLHY